MDSFSRDSPTMDVSFLTDIREKRRLEMNLVRYAKKGDGVDVYLIRLDGVLIRWVKVWANIDVKGAE